MTKKIIFVTAAIATFIALAYVVTMVALRPISADLSVIGKGKPALVLAYENFSMEGGEALERLRQIRGDYESRVDFVVADLGTPQGQAFAQRYRLIDGSAVFLDKDGTPLKVTFIPVDEQALREQLEHQLASVE